MPVHDVRPANIRGLDLGTDPTQADGALTVANGVRYLESGSIMSRSGRKRCLLDGTHMQAWQKVRGYTSFYDEALYTAPTSPKGTYVLNHLYKSGGLLWMNRGMMNVLPGDTKARFAVYNGKVVIVDGYSTWMFRRQVAASQVVGDPVKYEAVVLGMKFPIDDTKATVSVAVGAGSVNPAADPFPTAQTYRVRITIGDSHDIMSNPSVQSDDLTLLASDQNKALLIDWTALEAKFPYYGTKVGVWIQVSAGGTTTSYMKVPANAGTGKFDRSDAGYNSKFTLTNFVGSESWPTLEGAHGMDHGCPPKMLDVAIVNDVMCGIAVPDVIYREYLPTGQKASRYEPNRGPERTLIGDGMRNTRPPVPRDNNLPPAANPISAKEATVRAVSVDSSFLFLGKIGNPEYMEDWFIVGGGSESCTGICTLGSVFVVFTNKSIYIFDPQGPELKRAYSDVGCIAADSIVETSKGIFFLGTDSTYYLFNGATVQEAATQLLPIFKREDYSGYYSAFDATRADDIHATFGKDRLYVSMPNKTSSGGVPSKSLLVGDLVFGPTMWSIDLGYNYDILEYIGQEHRVLAIDEGGYFYWIEEGMADEQAAGLNDQPIYFEARIRKVPGASFQQAIFRKFSLDIDAGSMQLWAEVAIDDRFVYAYSIYGDGTRQDFKKPLPATFKGRYLDIGVRGSVTERVKWYAADVLADPRGVY